MKVFCITKDGKDIDIEVDASEEELEDENSEIFMKLEEEYDSFFTDESDRISERL